MPRSNIAKPFIQYLTIFFNISLIKATTLIKLLFRKYLVLSQATLNFQDILHRAETVVDRRYGNSAAERSVTALLFVIL